MGNHINKQGQFQSDKYPELTPDKILLSFKDEHTKKALALYAELAKGTDRELSEDILARLNTI